jgi:hypothetical protein
MQKHFRVTFFLLLVVLMFCRCSENNPLTPESILQIELAHFPLQEGYKASYKYSYSRTSGYFDNFYGKSETQWRKDGSFLLEIIESHKRSAEKAMFYKIRTTLAIHTDYHFNNPRDTVWSIGNDSTVIKEYEVMLKNGSLWYVDNAPDFKHLEQGDTTLMMASPIGSGGEMNLKLFPVITSANMSLNGVYGDTCNYYMYHSYASTVKNKGIISVYYRHCYGGITHSEDLMERCELIEH